MKRAGRVVRVLLLVAALWSVAAWGAARWLKVESGLARADALVVLGGSGAYVERTHRAAELWRAGRAPKIILTNDYQVSGWSVAEQRNPLFVERAFAELRAAGVPPEKIEVLPAPATGTYTEASLLRAYATERNVRSLLFVTSAYHSRRALWTVRRVFAGSNVEVGLDASAHDARTPRPLSWWLHAEGWSLVALEYPKLVYYRWQYR
ncbi:MAG TPA: YdcF family protein [Pyrinomonadaceae bacterium]|nr:YdcF family protein [Pyrinomonadaceae bacterium]